MTTDYTPPTSEEIRRVGEYWQRVKAMECQHTSFVSDSSGWRCGAECGRPLTVLSDLQMEERSRPLDREEVITSLIQQLDRGGVRFTTDGQRYEVRLHAHPDPLDPSPGAECVCIEVENVALMLRATEGGLL